MTTQLGCGMLLRIKKKGSGGLGMAGKYNGRRPCVVYHSRGGVLAQNCSASLMPMDCLPPSDPTQDRSMDWISLETGLMASPTGTLRCLCFAGSTSFTWISLAISQPIFVTGKNIRKTVTDKI